MSRNDVAFHKETVQDRRSMRLRRMPIPSIALMFIVLLAPMVRTEPYEVLVVDIADADDLVKIRAFEADAAKFNSLHRRG